MSDDIDTLSSEEIAKRCLEGGNLQENPLLKDGKAWGCKVINTEKGRGVLAGRLIPKGALVMRFEGPCFTRETCPDFSEAIQVGVDSWMWSSGGLDDLVNHSCDPNLGLFQQFKEKEGGTFLMAIKEIKAGEELSFDYSTSMVDEPWDLEGCLCESEKCRKLVGNFLDMDKEIQQYYADLDALPAHVWITAHARDIGLRNCAVERGLLQAVPSQKEKRESNRGYKEVLPPPAELARAGENAVVVNTN
jgi:hypothetical protein